MKTCEELEPTIQAYFAGELDDRELGPLLAHCRGCDGCRSLLELHRDLTGLATRAPMPERAEFDALHRRVLERTGRREAGTDGGRALRAAAALAAAVLIFAVGLTLGRGLFRPAVEPGGVGATQRLVSAIATEAASNRHLADVEESRFTFSNVFFRRLEGERVALDFDVTTHVQLVEPVESELVREALVHSLLHPSGTGTRLKAISFAAHAMEPKVREALIFAMRRDENLAVRLKALAILSDHLDDAEVESALLATLRDDESVQMRLVALDHLAAHSVDRVRIREVIEQSERPGDEALRVQLARFDDRL